MAYPSSIVAKILNLDVATGPTFAGTLPSTWDTLAFDDSAWPEAVVNGTGYIAGTDKIWYKTGATSYAKALIRHHFSLPTGAMVTYAQIQLEVDSAYYIVEVNGNTIEGAQILAIATRARAPPIRSHQPGSISMGAIMCSASGARTTTIRPAPGRATSWTSTGWGRQPVLTAPPVPAGPRAPLGQPARPGPLVRPDLQEREAQAGPWAQAVRPVRPVLPAAPG